MAASLTLRFEEGGEGEVTTLSGNILTAVAPSAFPPGKPMSFSVVLAENEVLALEGRSLGSRRRPDGRFDLRMRLVNLRREARDRLTLALE